MKFSSFLLLTGCLLLVQNTFASEIDTCTVNPDSTTFFSQHLNRTLPVHNLNEIVLLSVATQSMHGADKTGTAYLIDGVDVSKVMYKNGAFVQPDWAYTASHTMVNRNGNSLGSPTGIWDAITSTNYVNGRQSGMPRTAIEMVGNEIATAAVHAGTIPASYSASGGVVNLTTRTGGDRLTAALNLRSSIGHLNHAGPDMYNNNPDHNPDYLNGKSVAELYQEQRDKYLQYAMENPSIYLPIVEHMTWYPGQHHYGDKPRINGDFTLGGSLGTKFKFFLSADVLNDYGTLPGQFQRQIGASLKLNYQPNPKNNFTFYGKVSDQGKIGGWVNRSFSYYYLFNPEFNPVNQGVGLMSYAKWQHKFNSESNLELTVSYVGDYQTWGYKPIEKDGIPKLSATKTGDNWIRIDTAEDIEKYFTGESMLFPSIFYSTPYIYVPVVETGINIGLPIFYYENLKTEKLSATVIWSKTLNPHHEINAGANYSYNQIQRRNDCGATHSHTYNANFHISPWEAGCFFQDRIVYRGIQATIGCRVDAYQTGTKILTDIFSPATLEGDLLYDCFVPDYSKEAEPVMSISPRLAVSHPITQFSYVHYSWGIYTTPPDFTNLLYFYDFSNYTNYLTLRDRNMAPEKSMAWEMGLTITPAHNTGIDVTTYYRDSKNTDLLTFRITDIPYYRQFGGYYDTDFGYRDNFGVETTIWKQPSGERLFGIVDLSGTLSVEYAYERTARDGADFAETGGFVADLPWENYYSDIRDGDNKDFDFDQTAFWPTYSRSNNTYWNLKAAVRCDFPWQLELSHIVTFRSPWRYTQQLNVENTRSENKLNGEYFLQWDLQAAKYFSYKRFGVKLYCDVLNVMNRENILTFGDSWESYYHYYEKAGVPWGPYGKSTDQYGNLYTGIAREVYLGIELMLK